MTNLFGQSRWLVTVAHTMDSLFSIYTCALVTAVISQTSHLVVVPMFECHTTKNMFNMAVKFLNALYGQWRDKLIEVSFDGKNTMTGRHVHGLIRF